MDSKKIIWKPIDDKPVGPLTATGMSRARGTETVESKHIVLGSVEIGEQE